MRPVEEMLTLVRATKSDEEGARLLAAEYGGEADTYLMDAHAARGGTSYIDIIPLPGADLQQ